MKKIILLLLVGLQSYSYAQDLSVEYANSIKAEDLKKHLTFIASDSLKGRDTGSEGGRIAAQYISNHFFNLGLQPPVTTTDGNKSFFQTFTLYRKGWKDAYVKIGNKKKEFFKDYYPNGLVNIPEEQSINIVFAGYGIETPSYNDYENIIVKDKAVIFFEGEPKDKAGKNRLTKGNEKSNWIENVGFTNKINLAREKGAKFFFLISDNQATDFTSLASEKNKELIEKMRCQKYQFLRRISESSRKLF